MKIFFLLLLISSSAFPFSDTFLKMKPDRAYTSFIMGKYLDWHEKRFQFPKLTEFEKSLVSHFDHWLVDGHEELYQLTVGHRDEKDKTKILTVRFWVHPDLRASKELKGAGIPVNAAPWFVERDNTGMDCVITQKEETLFERWCKKTGEKSYSWNRFERIAGEHYSWKNMFPLARRSEIRLEDKNGTVTSIIYHKAFTHVSLIPKSLLNVISAHALETAFSMERYQLEKDQTMTVYYP